MDIYSDCDLCDLVNNNNVYYICVRDSDEINLYCGMCKQPFYMPIKCFVHDDLDHCPNCHILLAIADTSDSDNEYDDDFDEDDD